MIFKNIFVLPEYPEKLHKLFNIAYNLWWTWTYDAVNLFYRIDGQLFREANHNAVEFLHKLPKERIIALSKDKGFLFELEKLWQKFDEYMKLRAHSKKDDGEECGLHEEDIIACFSMEYGVHESLPIYAGGLGILFGDYLKRASDIGLPVIAIGLLYKYGYFNQRVSLDGRQEEILVEFENHFTPIKEVRDQNGEPAYIDVRMVNENVKAKLWNVDVGKVRLVLLDTDIEDNPPHLRDIVNELYITDREKRIQQELVLGLGGVKALELMNVVPKIYHLNEGHSAFLLIGRLQKLMQKEGFSFSEAQAIIRTSTVFTTHTPVIAGNENFKIELVKKYVEPEIKALGIDFKQLADFGFVNGDTETFWLPAFAIRFSRYINAVSKQHRDVARKMWTNIFPQRPLIEIPIDYVTNGVHISWVSESFTNVFNRYMGVDYMRCDEKEESWDNIHEIPDEEIWEAHRKNKRILWFFVRSKILESSAARGFSQAKSSKFINLFNPDHLTIVFAKRFASYKRATLILKDKERLRQILTNEKKPVQLIFSGKAHPADESGKKMIKEIIDFAKEYEVEAKVIFLENYEINIARHLIWGADVWLNYPIADNEASGTSGMKAAMNGVLNLSTLEGWWKEGFNRKNGWAINAGEAYSHLELREIAEANQIYELIEEEIAELYYDRNEAGIPEDWVKMMKESICSVCQYFNMNRVLQEYLRKLYIPCRKEFERIADNNYKLLKEAMVEEKEVLKYWNGLKLMHFSTDADKRESIKEGDSIHVDCTVNLGEAQPAIFAVELFYLINAKRNYKIIPLTLEKKEENTGYYKGSFTIEGHGLQNINVRIIPANDIVRDIHPELLIWKD
jgi:starch phosphorylase